MYMKLASHHHRLSQLVSPLSKYCTNHIHLLWKKRTVFANFPSFSSGSCVTISFSFFTQTVYLYTKFPCSLSIDKISPIFVDQLFCIHDILSQTNQHQSLSLLRLMFLHFVSALSNPSLFVKLFLFLSFFLLLVVFFFCVDGFYCLFKNNISCKTVSRGKQSRYVWNGSWMEWNNTSNFAI